MTVAYRIPVVIEPYPDGKFSIRSPLFPELISEGDTFEDAVSQVQDAVEAVLELYEDLKKPIPCEAIIEDPSHGRISFDLVTASA
jgi:antitoxin HicB